MSPLFCALVAALLGHAVCGPWIGPIERGVAAAAWLALLMRSRQRGACLVGLTLALLGGWQLHRARATAELWAGKELVARLRVVAGGGANTQRVQAQAPGLPPLSLRVYGDEHLGALRAAGAGLASLRVGELPQPRNPDDREPGRSALARGSLLSARLLNFAPERRGRLPAARDTLLVGVDRRLAGSAPLWRALLLGDRSEMDPRVQERVRRLGLSHLLALSGMHVGGMLGLLALTQRARRIPLWSLVPLLLWIVLAGASASLLRAGMMAGWWMLARRWQRVTRGEDAIAFAGWIDLAWNPARSGDVGWWLSYAATYSLIRVAGQLGGNKLRAALLLSSVAALATAPWSIAVFGQFVWLSPLSNLLVAIPFAVLMGLGVLLTLLGLLLPFAQPACDLWIQMLSHGFGALLWSLDWALPEPLGHPSLHGGQWALALVIWVLCFLPRPALRQRAALALALLLAAHLPLATRPQAQWWSLDVGQGDAGLLREGRSWLLLDSGPAFEDDSQAERVVLPFLRRRNLRDVGYAITHGHLDHMGGAAALLQSGRIGALFIAASDSAEHWARPLREICAQRAIPIHWLARGDTLRHRALALPVLWPPALDAPEHANDRSLVLLAGAPGSTLLLTGDLEREGEGALLAGELPQGVAVLKLAHHGGDTGSDDAWLRRLAPQVALISCGRGNRYGHPHPAVMQRLADRGIPTLRTDELGCLEVRWGRTLELRTRRGPLDPSAHRD